MIDGEVIAIVLLSGLGVGFCSGILVAAFLGREKKAAPAGDRFTCVARGERSGGLWVDKSCPPIPPPAPPSEPVCWHCKHGVGLHSHRRCWAFGCVCTSFCYAEEPAGRE